jgi:hypothetical protein
LSHPKGKKSTAIPLTDASGVGNHHAYQKQHSLSDRTAARLGHWHAGQSVLLCAQALRKLYCYSKAEQDREEKMCVRWLLRALHNILRPFGELLNYFVAIPTADPPAFIYVRPPGSVISPHNQLIHRYQLRPPLSLPRL